MSLLSLTVTSDACLQEPTQTWHTCFHCVYSLVDREQCSALEAADQEVFEQCPTGRGFNMVDVSNYAAQIGWWLNFFPPERFIVVSSLELRNEEGRITVRPCPCLATCSLDSYAERMQRLACCCPLCIRSVANLGLQS